MRYAITYIELSRKQSIIALQHEPGRAAQESRTAISTSQTSDSRANSSNATSTKLCTVPVPDYR